MLLFTLLRPPDLAITSLLCRRGQLPQSRPYKKIAFTSGVIETPPGLYCARSLRQQPQPFSTDRLSLRCALTCSVVASATRPVRYKNAEICTIPPRTSYKYLCTAKHNHRKPNPTGDIFRNGLPTSKKANLPLGTPQQNQTVVTAVSLYRHSKQVSITYY